MPRAVGRVRMSPQAYAWQRITYLVKLGKLPRAAELPCFDCGRSAVEYDHYFGYDHPESVVPVCRACHARREWARGIKKGFPKQQRTVPEIVDRKERVAYFARECYRRKRGFYNPGYAEHVKENRMAAARLRVARYGKQPQAEDGKFIRRQDNGRV